MKTQLKTVLSLSAGSVLLLFDPAHAMHISEGILPLPWALLWFVLSIPFIVMGLRELASRTKDEPHLKAMLGLIGAAVFIISCMPIPVPTAGTCSHPTGTGMAAILIGPSLTVLVASIALTLQALFLAHGGITTLGADIFSMGVAGAFSGYGAFLLCRKLGASLIVAAFAAGIVSDWVTYGFTSLALAAALHTDGSFFTMFGTIMVAFMPTQIPLGILEGFISAGAYSFIHARRPEYLALMARGNVR